MTLGEYIKQYRFEHGMSLRDFEERSGVSKSQIGMLERGKTNTPSFKTFAAIAAAMGLTVQELNERCGDIIISGNGKDKLLTEREELAVKVNQLSDEQVHYLLPLISDLLNNKRR